MNQSDESPVFFFQSDDPAMNHANQQARETFRFYWRELAWERRRIVPGLTASCIKAPFCDPPGAGKKEDAGVEEMWVGDVDFDGEFVSGTLLNTPNWLTSVHEGESVRVAWNQISDWLYAIGERAYGAFTVNLMRAEMSSDERREHDDAWGLDFGDPSQVAVVTNNDATGPGTDLESDHSMSINMVDSFEEFLLADPENAQTTDERSWSLLHELSLAGSAACVPIVLKHGANPNAATNDGKRPLQLARALNWTTVADILVAHGAT